MPRFIIATLMTVVATTAFADVIPVADVTIKEMVSLTAPKGSVVTFAVDSVRTSGAIPEEQSEFLQKAQGCEYRVLATLDKTSKRALFKAGHFVCSSEMSENLKGFSAPNVVYDKSLKAGIPVTCSNSACDMATLPKGAKGVLITQN